MNKFIRGQDLQEQPELAHLIHPINVPIKGQYGCREELSLEVHIFGGIKEEHHRWVTIFCPRPNCNFSSTGKSMTDSVRAFSGAAENMHKHLRHVHQCDVLTHDVENSYMPQINLLVDQLTN